MCIHRVPERDQNLEFQPQNALPTLPGIAVLKKAIVHVIWLAKPILILIKLSAATIAPPAPGQTNPVEEDHALTQKCIRQDQPIHQAAHIQQDVLQMQLAQQSRQPAATVR